MAVAEMSVLTLVAVKDDKNAILDAIFQSGSAQIKSCKEYELAAPCEQVAATDIAQLIERAERAVGTIKAVNKLVDKSEKAEIAEDGFGVTKEEFFKAAESVEELTGVIKAIEDAVARRAEIAQRTAAVKAKILSFMPYAELKAPFSYYQPTKKTVVYLGLIPNEKVAEFCRRFDEENIVYEVIGAYKGETCVVTLAHKKDKNRLDDLISKFSFRKCGFVFDKTAAALLEELESERAALRSSDEKEIEYILGFAKEVKRLKLFADFLAFTKDKAEADGNFADTKRAFVLEAYVPTEFKQKVLDSIAEATKAVVLKFDTVKRDEFAPTLNKNGKAIENFETVTNMYSAPAYGALDPNAVMSFFFSLFMGVIMADVGYGVLMAVGGFLFAKTKREGTSVNRMSKVFAIGGLFAVLFGALFDSWMGYPLLRTLLPSSYGEFYTAHLDQITAYTSIAGIDVPAILMWCLALGTAQMAVGLVLKAVQSFTRGRVLEGVFGGLVWAVALFALIFWVLGMATGNGLMESVGLYVTAGSVILGVVTAGIGEKGFGVVIKSFTSAYGLINYVSDILSYARLYGLMLSGAQIASIFTNTLAIGMLFPLGAGGVVAGVILIIVGNVFNLAINLLGAYIHDARLQYVEFYGKFYEGEGELFVPFGSRYKHSYFEQSAK